MSQAGRNVMLTGGWAHDFPQTAPVLAAEIDAAAPTSTELHWEGDALADALSQPADLVTVYACQFRMLDQRYTAQNRADFARDTSPALMDALTRHVQDGKPLLAVHTAAVCFDDWAGWGELLGGAWRWESSWHPPPQSMEVHPSPGTHPFSAGQPFTITDERYTDLEVGPASTVWATSPSDHGSQPVVWSHQSCGGPVVYTSLGHSVEALQSIGHRQLLQVVLEWLLGDAPTPLPEGSGND